MSPWCPRNDRFGEKHEMMVSDRSWLRALEPAKIPAM